MPLVSVNPAGIPGKILNSMQTTSAGHENPEFRRSMIQALLLFVVTIVVLMVFRSFPEIDLFVSSRLFSATPCKAGATIENCGVFPFQRSPILIGIRQISLLLPYILMGIGTIYLVYRLFFKGDTTAKELEKFSLVGWTMIIATIGLINFVLKEFWGRPRPFQVEGLGGDKPFVLPGTITDHCASNCSFVSGEASSAAWLFTLLVFVPGKWRLPMGLVIGAYTIFFSGMRVAFGKHFVSDVVISVLITLCVFLALRAVFSTRSFQNRFVKIASMSNQFVLNRNAA